METSHCPECGATIGGRSHTLNSDNRRAPELDALDPNALVGPTWRV